MRTQKAAPRPVEGAPSPRASLVRQHGQGDLIACATLQPGLSYYENSHGFWAYRRVRGMDVTLGGPICDAVHRPAMVEGFLTQATRPVLCYVQESLLGELHGTGLHVAGMGVDRRADVDALLAAPTKEVGGAVKKARRAGVRIEEVHLRDLDSVTQRRLSEITERYLAHAECTVEMSFINQPMSFVDDGLRRVFLLSKNDREHQGVFGYAVLNPIFERGEVTSYVLDLLRFEPTRLWGVWLSTVWHMARLLSSEGLGLHLGFCPLFRVSRPAGGGSRLLGVQMQGMERLLSSAQYLRRLRELKGLIPGRDEPRYFASFSRSGFVALFAFMEALGVGFSYLLGPDLLRVIGAGLRGGGRTD